MNKLTKRLEWKNNDYDDDDDDDNSNHEIPGSCDTDVKLVPFSPGDCSFFFFLFASLSPFASRHVIAVQPESNPKPGVAVWHFTPGVKLRHSVQHADSLDTFRSVKRSTVLQLRTVFRNRTETQTSMDVHNFFIDLSLRPQEMLNRTEWLIGSGNL